MVSMLLLLLLFNMSWHLSFVYSVLIEAFGSHVNYRVGAIYQIPKHMVSGLVSESTITQICYSIDILRELCNLLLLYINF